MSSLLGQHHVAERVGEQFALSSLNIKRQLLRDTRTRHLLVASIGLTAIFLTLLYQNLLLTTLLMPRKPHGLHPIIDIA